MKLHLATDLTLPLDATTQAIGVVAKRRVGKSYTARRFAEQLFKAGQQIAIVDPKGDWWGIRSAADGKSPGLPVVILGGERGDVPLEVGGGEVVAKLVVEERVSVLLDLSLFRKREVARFMTDFLETLYRLKAKEAMRTPLMLIIDEADAIAPQKPQEGEERMLGAAEDIVRRGGQRGIGCMMITQRTAVLNKNVLTQCEMLVALRTIAPQDLKAMQAWIDVHGSIEERDTLMASLPSLPVGDAWFWSPGWPTSAGIFKHVHVLPIETFDSGATPKSGEKRVEPKNVADVDLAALTRQMSATIERAKADDPKALRARIKELEAAARKAPQPIAGADQRAPDQKAIDRAVATAMREHASTVTALQKALDAAMKFIVNISTANFDVAGVDKAELEKAVTAAVDRATKLIGDKLEERARTVRKLKADAEQILRTIEKVTGAAREVTVDVAVTKNEPFRVAAASTNGHKPLRTPREPRAPREPVDGLTKGQQKILNALAELHAIGIERTTRQQLGMFAGYNLTGGSGAQHIADLVGLGLVEIPEQGSVQLTDAGHQAADATDVPSSLDELHQRVLARASSGQRRIAEHLISIYPEGISRADLGEAVGYNLTGGSGAQHVADLVTLGAACMPRQGQVAASSLLFPESLS